MNKFYFGMAAAVVPWGALLGAVGPIAAWTGIAVQVVGLVLIVSELLEA